MSSKHLGTLRISDHEIRFVLSPEARGGCYAPELHVYLKGPNGSPAGFGEKCWPRWLVRLFEPGHDWRKRHRPWQRPAWSSMLAIRLPHLTWRRGYKLRRIGGLKLYAAIQRGYFACAR